MSDFASILNRTAGEAKRPPTLPPGTYLAQTGQHEFGRTQKASKSGKTPAGTDYVRFHYSILSPMGDVPPEQLVGVDFGKQRLWKDFYLTEEFLYILDEYLKNTCKIDLNGGTYQQTIPLAAGKQVMLSISNQPSQQAGDDRIFAQIDKIAPAQ